MDVSTNAYDAVLLMSHYLLAVASKSISDTISKVASNKINSKIETLYKTIKKNFNENNYAKQTLKRLEEKPEDEDRQIALKSVLEDALTKDQELQKILIQLLTEIKQVGGDNIIQVQGNGAIATQNSTAAGKQGLAVGGDINISRHLQ